MLKTEKGGRGAIRLQAGVGVKGEHAEIFVGQFGQNCFSII